MAELLAAVCTNRPAAAVGQSLEALRRQLPAASVMLVTSGLEPAQVAAHRAAFDGQLLVEPRPGLSRARNRALAAAAAETDVLCFVDDDAVVMPGWADALAGRWDEAPDDVACIGGPIAPRYLVPPPGWLSPAILPALTVLDLGDTVRELDPATTTVYGANVSFRVGPLRTVGGFDPAFGHSGGRVFFSEEDEAQRALARAGFRIRYVPDAGVWHLIAAERLTRVSFVRRRFAYGTTLGARRARSPGLALRQAASSGGGCLPALLRRDDALAMERAVRAAENLGVLFAPIARRR